MTERNQLCFHFNGLKGKPVEVDFGGGDISSDGGCMLLAQADTNLQLLSRVASLLPDDRDAARIEHTMSQMLRQRVFGLALAYEDLNDHTTLRHDPLFCAVAGKERALASASTLCRFENRADRRCAMAINEVLIDIFIASHREPPQQLILDFDATDDPVHGNQEGRFFHGFYRHYCFLPLYAFCGEHLLCAWLRPSRIDGARGAWFLLKVLTNRLRQAWPGVQIILRADSGFCRWRMLRWCDQNQVDYIIGVAKNNRLETEARHLLDQAQAGYERTQTKCRILGWITYQAKSWDRRRLLIAKAEHGEQGSNPRFLVTSLSGEARQLYEEVYCARGEMENRIKEQQLGLFADRTSCHAWWPNQLRLLLSALAYTLLVHIRQVGLQGTDLAKAQVGTIRLKLLKIGAVVLRNTRRIRVHLSSAYPLEALFRRVAQRLQLSSA